MALAPMWSAFNELTTERQNGMALGVIPSSRIWDYAARNGLDEDEADRLHTVLRRVDSEYLAMNTPGKEEPNLRRLAPMNDPAGLRGLFGSLEARGKKKNGP